MDEQTVKDIALIDSLAAMKSELFHVDLDIFPMDMRYAILATKCVSCVP